MKRIDHTQEAERLMEKAPVVKKKSQHTKVVILRCI